MLFFLLGIVNLGCILKISLNYGCVVLTDITKMVMVSCLVIKLSK